MWFRRDLRMRDHPALLAALEQDHSTVALFVLDPRLWDSAGEVRRAWLAANLLALDERMDGRLVVRRGDPAEVVPAVAAQVEADTVHVSAETTPYGVRRDAIVASALASAARPSCARPDRRTPWVRGWCARATGSPYQVFTPFARAWREHGWADPAPTPRAPELLALPAEKGLRKVLQDAARAGSRRTARSGRGGGLASVAHVPRRRLGDYDPPGTVPPSDGTSRLSPYLSLGALHPRSLLADAADAAVAGAPPSSPSWRGGSSTPTCSTTARTRRGPT